MANDTAISEKTVPAEQNDVNVFDAQTVQCFSPDAVLMRKMVDETLATVKDDRINTKKAISADIASEQRVQNQNERVIEACERELRRRDLSDERREALLDKMERAAGSTAYAHNCSMEFRSQQLAYSHNFTMLLIAATISGIIGIACGSLYYNMGMPGIKKL